MKKIVKSGIKKPPVVAFAFLLSIMLQDDFYNRDKLKTEDNKHPPNVEIYASTMLIFSCFS